MFFKIFQINNKKEEEQVMNELNAWGKACYDARKKEVLDGMENDLQRVIFLDWWSGGSLWESGGELGKPIRAKRYQHVNEHDWETARGWIMETISIGMG